MILKRIIISNFRGINEPRTIYFKDFNCIVGQNDAGKSTILRALDCFLNDTKPSRADYNSRGQDNTISIEVVFDCQNKPILLGEQIETTIEKEELVNEENLLCLRKTWSVGESTIGNPKSSIIRKKYTGENDFISKTEAQLIALCRANEIQTVKGNGEEYNNVEKRQKLRERYIELGIGFVYDYEEIPSSGTSKIKSIGDAIKKALPDFQYFKADTSLSDTDTAIQKYFKELAFNKIENELDTEEIEAEITVQLSAVLEKITDKINAVVTEQEKIEPHIEFDWSKLISTSFRSKSSGNDIPLSSRGDGFRRLTMMAYFEYLAETHRTSYSHQIIFGFEEPETFLHPTIQESLFEKLNALTENGYQVLISTHSPIIVGKTKPDEIIHITKPGNVYSVRQWDVDYKQIAIDLGIKPDNTFAPLFSSSRLLFLVEGIDDATAMKYIANKYKFAGLIERDFDELQVAIIPIGGADSINHWVNLDLFTRLEKPFFIFQDSDKERVDAVSPREQKLLSYGLVLNDHFSISQKRMIENYLPCSALKRLVSRIHEYDPSWNYGDFEHVKNLCKDFPDDSIRAHIGGKSVVAKHYCSLTLEELRSAWCPDSSNDEFLFIYNIIMGKLGLSQTPNSREVVPGTA